MPSATGTARRDETPAAASSAGVSTAPRARRSRLRALSSVRRLGGLARCPVDEIRQHLPEPLWSIEVERYRREEERRAAKRLHDRRSRMREQICRVRPSARVEHPLPERAELRVGLEARQGPAGGEEPAPQIEPHRHPAAPKVRRLARRGEHPIVDEVDHDRLPAASARGGPGASGEESRRRRKPTRWRATAGAGRRVTTRRRWAGRRTRSYRVSPTRGSRRGGVPRSTAPRRARDLERRREDQRVER